MEVFNNERKRKLKLLLLALLLSEEEELNEEKEITKGSKHRTVWVRETFQNRDNASVFVTLNNEMRVKDPSLFSNFTRCTPSKFDELLNILGPYIEKEEHIREPISAAERLAITLRYLASGDSMGSLSYSFKVGRSTVSGIIKEVTKAIWSRMKEDMFPKLDETEFRRIAEGFNIKFNFPHCIGSVDGKHVQVQKPGKTGSEYYNYKKHFSLVLMAVCDSSFCFTYCDIGGYGRQSDGGTFRASSLGKMLFNEELNLPAPENLGQRGLMPCTLIGDEAFPLTSFLMRPYPGNTLDDAKTIFNYRLSSARQTIEITFGILASRWRIFRRPINTDIKTAEYIVKAAVCLHNFLQRRGDCMAAQNYTLDDSTRLPKITTRSDNSPSKEGLAIREKLTQYFMCEGAIPSQWNRS